MSTGPTSEQPAEASTAVTTATAVSPAPDAAPPANPAVADRLVTVGGIDESFHDFAVGWGKRVRSGETGLLPVVGGLIVLTVIFQLNDSAFLSAGNLTNLLVQGMVFMLLGMAEVFVLMLGEIDLSIGYVAGLGAAVACILSAYPNNVAWWWCVLAGLATTTAIGLLQGTLITRLRLPSFVVTLAGLLGWEGVLIYLINSDGGSTGGTIEITNNILNDIVNGNLSDPAGWIVVGAIVVVFGVFVMLRDRNRRIAGLAAPPTSVSALKVAMIAVAGVVVVLICNANRGTTAVVEGMPWVILVALAILVAWTVLLGRTRFGRYLYAIGGNAEAARRAGISLTKIRTLAFGMAGLTAGIGGVVYASRLGSISNDVDGGTLVLYAVAAAVIGGASLFGGRGKMVHAVVGGIVIAAINNGMGLIGLGAAQQYMITALVLLAAVTVDSVARRGRTSV